MSSRHLLAVVGLVVPLWLAPHATAAVPWYDGDVDAGLAASAADGKATLVYFTAAWCPACQRLQSELLATPAGAKATANLRAIKVDVDAPGGDKLVERFVILGYPTAVLLDASGTTLGRVVGFDGKAAWAAELKALRAVERPVKALREAVAREPGKAQATLALGRALLERRQRDEGEALLQLVTLRWPASEASAEALWCLGRYYHRVRREPVTAQHIWRELGERHAGTPWAGGAWWWFAKAQVALGRTEMGANALEAIARRRSAGVRPLQSYVGFVVKHQLLSRYPTARALVSKTLKGRLSTEERTTLRTLLADLKPPPHTQH